MDIDENRAKIVGEEGEAFAEKMAKELEGKTPAEVLPLELAGVAFGCLKTTMGGLPDFVTDRLHSLITLVAYSTMKYQEKKGVANGKQVR